MRIKREGKHFINTKLIEQAQPLRLCDKWMMIRKNNECIIELSYLKVFRLKATGFFCNGLGCMHMRKIET